MGRIGDLGGWNKFLLANGNKTALEQVNPEILLSWVVSTTTLLVTFGTGLTSTVRYGITDGGWLQLHVITSVEVI